MSQLGGVPDGVEGIECHRIVNLGDDRARVPGTGDNVGYG